MQSNSPSLSAKQQRWWSFITEFTSDIRHISGSSNVVADALSRVVYVMGTNAQFTQRLAAAQLQDPGLGLLFDPANRPADCPFATLQHEEHTLLGFSPTGSFQLFRPVVPSSMQEEVIASFHDLAHAGVKATQKLVKENFGWRGMSAQIADFVRNCTACQQSKVNIRHKAPLQAFLPPASRFLDLHVDVVGPLPSCRGNTYLFTIVDRYTRYPVAVPMPSSSAEDCARALLEGWVQHFGVPTNIVSDRGAQFTSTLWANLSSCFGVHLKQTTSYHPQANGICERMHRQLKAALRARLTSDDWLTQLPVVLLGIRAAVKEDIGSSAAQMVFGSSPRLPGCIAAPARAEAENVFLRRIQETARNLAFTSPNWHGNDRPRQLRDLATCGYVHVQVSRIHPTLDPQFEGPFRVVQRNDKVFLIDRHGVIDSVSVDRLIPAPGVHDVLGEEGSVPPQTVTRYGRASRPVDRFQA
jgi:transposase InsO family protein